MAVDEYETKWDYFISHQQKESGGMALDFYLTLGEMGQKCWLDVKMDRRGEDAMRQGLVRALNP